MKLNPLPSREYLAECLDLDPETGIMIWKVRPLSHFKSVAAQRIWNARQPGRRAFVNAANGGGFRGDINRRHFLAHRVVWKLFYGVDPSGEIDHIDGNPANNSISNLREVVRRENCRNRALSRNNTSGVSGVHFCRTRKKWGAVVNDNIGRRVLLGYFVEKDAAVAARKAAEKSIGYHENHGRPARETANA